MFLLGDIGAKLYIVSLLFFWSLMANFMQCELNMTDALFEI